MQLNWSPDAAVLPEADNFYMCQDVIINRLAKIDIIIQTSDLKAQTVIFAMFRHCAYKYRNRYQVWKLAFSSRLFCRHLGYGRWKYLRTNTKCVSYNHYKPWHRFSKTLGFLQICVSSFRNQRMRMTQLRPTSIWGGQILWHLKASTIKPSVEMS